MYIIYANNTAEFGNGFKWAAPTKEEAEKMMKEDIYFHESDIHHTTETEDSTTHMFRHRFTL